MNAFKELVVTFAEAIKSPFEAIAVTIDETRRENLDGKYDRYWARKNKRTELRELRRDYRAGKLLRFEYRIYKRATKNEWKEARKNG